VRALYLSSPGKTEVKEIDRPVAQKGQVLLRVGMVGFCGGDLNGYRGLFPLQEFPNILGHEIGATIESVGTGVPDRFKPGLKVTVNPYKNCGQCISCRRNRPNACIDNRTMGVRRPGAMTSYITVPWEELFVSETLDVKALAIVEPLTVGFHAVDRVHVCKGERVAVFGCGVVGLGAIAASARKGAEIIAVDIEDKKLDLARKAGAAHVINSAKTDLSDMLRRMTLKDGPDVIIEAVGSSQTYKAAVETLAFIGRAAFIGYAKTPVDFETKLIVQKELEIYGSRNCNVKIDFPAVISMLETTRFPVDDIITCVVSIDDAGARLADWSNNLGRYTKILVSFEN